MLYVLKSGNTDKIYLLKDKFVELDNNLEIVRTVNLPLRSPIGSYLFDVNNDNVNEFLIYSEVEEKLVVYDADLVRMAELKFKTPDPQWQFSKYQSGKNEHKFFIQSGNSGFFVEVKKNDLRLLGYLVYPGAYLLVLLFIILIKRINTLQVVQKESLNRRLVTLQLQGIKSQLDPHFTFNTLNSIASLIYLEDREVAYDYMNKFTQLLRSLLNDAERIYRSLAEELDFVTTYLDLEKLRFGDKFNYEINIGENVNRQAKVPKLVLQTFSENAIKHGIMSCEGVGILKINAERKDNYLILSIEDNGIGRAKAEGMSLSTGKGLKLTGEFYDILNQLNKKPIRHTIIDLYNGSGESAGTRVEVWVPVD
jgi:two-component sensor histidine kinase